MKSVVPLIIGSIIFLSCSQPHHRGISYEERTKHLNVFNDLDTNLIEGAIKPFDYKWNMEGFLIDLTRQKYSPPNNSSNYPNPFSPPSNIPIAIHKSDSIKLYLCNTDESSCVKLFDEYLEKGLYSYGFQKLDLRQGKYVVKILSKYSVYFQTTKILP